MKNFSNHKRCKHDFNIKKIKITSPIQDTNIKKKSLMVIVKLFVQTYQEFVKYFPVSNMYLLQIHPNRNFNDFSRIYPPHQISRHDAGGLRCSHLPAEAIRTIDFKNHQREIMEGIKEHKDLLKRSIAGQCMRVHQRGVHSRPAPNGTR